MYRIYLIPESARDRRLLVFGALNDTDEAPPTVSWNGPDALRVELTDVAYCCAVLQNWNRLGVTVTVVGTESGPVAADTDWSAKFVGECHRNG